MRSYRGMLVGAVLGLLLGGGSSLFAANPQVFPSTMAAMTAIANSLANPLTVTGTTSATPLSVNMTSVPITLGAGVDATLVADQTTTPRKHITLMNISTGTVTLNFGSAATAGQGITLDPASVDGGQGGAFSWDGMTLPSNAIHGISAAGSRVAVTVGN